MSKPHNKYYVVWEGRVPGIYTTWDQCREQVENWPQARYKAFNNVNEATEAFRGSLWAQLDVIRAIVENAGTQWADDRPTAGIAVDGACAGNPGKMEYRAVDIATGTEIFRRGADGKLVGTNNIAEYLALVHIGALLASRGDTATVVYTDSRTALSWLRHHHSKSTLARSKATAPVLDLLERADAWVASHTYQNRIVKWDTDRWGEIPADFGRK